MVRGRRRDEEKRERILQAALRVFSRKGFYKSRVSEIAKEAGVADGTIYLYFKNKDDLLISIFEEKIDELIRILREKLEGVESPEEKMRIFIENHLFLLQRNRALAEMLQVELRQSNKFMKEYVPVKFLEYLDLLAEIIEEGKRKGVFKEEINPTIARRIVFGALDEISLAWVLSKKRKYDLEESARQVYSILVDGMKVRERAVEEKQFIKEGGYDQF
ncbi:MAG: TetR/AcrR family transcriptional regulator [Deltaproteobacteria bacterium]|nr:MAG: TetR/AcrR family transcriptional regulator [Deltaproteobacteria bacterium]